MPTDLLAALSGLPSTSVLIALIVASSLLVITADWRLLNLILGAQYLLIGVFLIVVGIEEVPVELAIVKALVGTMIVPVLYITARRARWGKPPDEDETEVVETPRPRLAWLRSPSPSALLRTGLALRAIVAVIGAAIALSLALRSPIAITTSQTSSRDISIATFVLIGQGLLNIALNENPLKAGLGLLTVMAGFEMFYTVIEPTLLVVALLGLVNLVIALALSFLITAWATRPREVTAR
jgi:hypothetical protein